LAAQQGQPPTKHRDPAGPPAQRTRRRAVAAAEPSRSISMWPIRGTLTATGPPKAVIGPEGRGEVRPWPAMAKAAAAA